MVWLFTRRHRPKPKVVEELKTPPNQGSSGKKDPIVIKVEIKDES